MKAELVQLGLALAFPSLVAVASCPHGDLDAALKLLLMQLPGAQVPRTQQE
jgi:hypothetical protein